MIKRLVIMLLIVGLILGGVFGFKSFQNAMIKKYMGAMGKQPQTVSTTVAKFEEWQNRIHAVGSLAAVRGVDVSSEVAGVIEGIYFDSGDYVEAGTLLVKLRSDDDIAVLNSLQAEAHLAELTYKRDYRQLQEKTIPQATVDADVANLQKARALVAQQEAIIAKKYIRAPFSGRLGITGIDLGEYLKPGDVIVTLQELDPIYFNFYLPQQQLAKLKIGQDVITETNLYPDEKFNGKIYAINSKVDESTRNIQVQALLDNKDNKLLPGMYAVVDIDLGIIEKHITLPQTAITYNPYGNTVFVVKDDVAEQRFVKLGDTRGDQVAVLDGLKEGEVVVSAGQLKLQNGSRVKINNSVLPTNDIEPQLTD